MFKQSSDFFLHEDTDLPQVIGIDELQDRVEPERIVRKADRLPGLPFGPGEACQELPLRCVFAEREPRRGAGTDEGAEVDVRCQVLLAQTLEGIASMAWWVQVCIVPAPSP